MTRQCPASGRIVAATVARRSIFTRGQWIGACPSCKAGAPWGLSEVRRDGMGYVKRYLPHEGR